MTKLTIIGAGSISEALLSGIIKSRFISGDNIMVTNRSNEVRLQELHIKYGIKYSYNIKSLMSNTDAIILAMKPKDVKDALEQIKEYVTENSLLISVLAGVSIKSMEKLLDKKIPIVRAMPNTSATIGKSATGVALNEFVNEPQRLLVQKIFDTVGLTAFVAESQLDGVTGLSGSGPAYIYYLVEAMEKGATEIGLEREMAKQLIIQTLLGAAEMVVHSSKTPAELRKNVTSPGGTTEAGIKILDSYSVQSAIIKCIKEATAQSLRMGKTINEELEIPK